MRVELAVLADGKRDLAAIPSRRRQDRREEVRQVDLGVGGADDFAIALERDVEARARQCRLAARRRHPHSGRSRRRRDRRRDSWCHAARRFRRFRRCYFRVGLNLFVGFALRFGNALLRFRRAELDSLRDAHHALVHLGHDAAAIVFAQLLPLPFGHELPDDVAAHRTDVDHEAVAWRRIGVWRRLDSGWRRPAIAERRWHRWRQAPSTKSRGARVCRGAVSRRSGPDARLDVVGDWTTARTPGAAAEWLIGSAGSRRWSDSGSGSRGRRSGDSRGRWNAGSRRYRWHRRSRRRWTAEAATTTKEGGGPPAGTWTAEAAELDVLEQHRHLAERLRDLRLLRHAARRCRGRNRRCGRALGAGRRLERRCGGIRLGARFRDVHQAFDTLAELCRDDLHPLRELARQQLRFAARGFAHRPRVARVGEERDRRQRHDRQKEKCDDQPETKAHSY